MNFFGHGWEILLVLVIVLIIFGPGRLPELGSALGKGIREFRRTQSEIIDAVRTTEPTAPPAAPAASAPPATAPSATAPEPTEPPADTPAH
jgi:TatA/E family protein of Tat protein translocase